MPLADYLSGVFLFVATTGSAVGAAALLTFRRLPPMPTSARLAAFATIATAAIIGCHLLPAILGVLAPGTAAGCALALLGASLWATRAARMSAAPDGEGRTEPPSSALSRVVAALGVVSVAVFALAAAWEGTGIPSIGPDSLTFHLPQAARWMQTGTVWRVDQFEPLLANGHYPQNGDVLFLSFLLPWENDAFVRLLNLASLGFLGLAAYALARELSTPRAPAALGATLVLSLPQTILVAQEGAKTDLWLLATLAAGMLFLLRHWRTGERADLVLAGVALGLALGTKWYGLSSVAIVLIVWLGALLFARRGFRQVVGQGALVVTLAALAGGFWLVRNWVVSGNPVFPAQVELAGLTVLDAPRDLVRECAGFAIADYLDSPSVLLDFVWPVARFAYGYGAAAMLAGLVLAVALAASRLRRLLGNALGSDRYGAVLVLAVVAGLFAVAYLLTPYSAFGAEDRPVYAGANLRYALPVFAVAAPLTAWAIARLGRLRLPAELAGLAAVVEGLRQGYELPTHLVIAAAAGAGLVAAALYALRILVRRLERRAARRIVIAAMAMAALGVVAVGHVRQREFNEDRYRGRDATLDWIARHAPAGRRIGIVGFESTTGPYVLQAFGPRLRNEVSYVGKTVDGQLREHRTPERFTSALERGGYDLLLIAKGSYRLPCRFPGYETDEAAWAEREGYEKVAESEGLVLYRLGPSPDRGTSTS